MECVIRKRAGAHITNNKKKIQCTNQYVTNRKKDKKRRKKVEGVREGRRRRYVTLRYIYIYVTWSKRAFGAASMASSINPRTWRRRLRGVARSTLTDIALLRSTISRPFRIIQVASFELGTWRRCPAFIVRMAVERTPTWYDLELIWYKRI